MKIDRLIGILSILLQKENVTAPDLAKHFEVSRRTINRDIDALCQAGIPIVTKQGVNGGISIMDGFRIALFDKECKWRLIEEFGSGCFEELQNGRLLFHRRLH